MKPGYKIVFDYGAHEGMKFFDDVEYFTVAAAVKVAIEANYGIKFLIVQVVNWEAKVL